MIAGAGARQEWKQAAGVVAIAILAIAASAIGVRNGFTYDDRYIVELNRPVHDLAHWWRLFGHSYWPAEWGGDGYRPLTMLAFAVQWAIGDGTPAVFHAVNILLYVGGALALYALAAAILPPAPAWIAAALFAVHPVHVEAVANIVGQSELWVGLLTLGALALHVRRRNAGTFGPGWQVAVAAMVLAACFFKEHGVVIPLLLLVAELVLVRDREPLRTRFVRLRPYALGLAAVLTAYLGVRLTVLPHLSGFTPYVPFDALGMSDAQRQMTMVALVPEWVRLLLFPARLSAEYGPPAQPLLLEFDWSVIPGALILLAVLGLGVLGVRRHPAVSFGIALLVLTLLPTSNFIVASGILMAERTLYLPSAGAMLAVAAGIPFVALRLIDHAALRLAAGAMVGAILAAGVWRSHARTQVWESNDRLIVQSALDAPEVYRAHYMLGAYHFGNHRWRLGEEAFRTAMRLFPEDPFVAHNLGEQYRKRNLCVAAIPYYQHAVAIAAGFRDTRARLAICLFEVGRLAESRAEAWEALRRGIGPPRDMIRLLHALADEAGRPASESGILPEPAQNTPVESVTSGRG